MLHLIEPKGSTYWSPWNAHSSWISILLKDCSKSSGMMFQQYPGGHVDSMSSQLVHWKKWWAQVFVGSMFSQLQSMTLCTTLLISLATECLLFLEFGECYQRFFIFLFGPIPWGHSGPLCHALSLSSSSSWTSCRRRAKVAAVATPGEWQCKAARSSEWAQHFSNASCLFLARNVIYTSRAYATMSVSVCLSICLSVCLWRKCIGAL